MMREIMRVPSGIISSPLDILVYSEGEFNERALLTGILEHKIFTQGIKNI